MSNRDNQGRFLVGNPGGPGRPAKVSEEKLIRAFSLACGESEIFRITKAMVRLAVGGSIPAARLLYQFCLPLPAQRITIETGDDAFRVAGDADPGTIGAEMLQRIQQKVSERRAEILANGSCRN